MRMRIPIAILGSQRRRRRNDICLLAIPIHRRRRGYRCCSRRRTRGGPKLEPTPARDDPRVSKRGRARTRTSTYTGSFRYAVPRRGGRWRISTPSGQNPRVAHRRLGLEPAVRIPGQTFRDKVDKELVFAFQHLSERPAAGSTALAFGVDEWPRRSARVYTSAAHLSTEYDGFYSPKNSFLRCALLMMDGSGTPRTSMMQASCSCSFSPGKIGTPVYSSARMHLLVSSLSSEAQGRESGQTHPRLHISIAMA